MERRKREVRERPVTEHFSLWHPELSLPLLEFEEGFQFENHTEDSPPPWAERGYPTWLLALGHEDLKKVKRLSRSYGLQPAEVLSYIVHAGLENPAEALASHGHARKRRRSAVKALKKVGGAS